MKGFMFIVLMTPLALFSQVPNIKKGELQFEKDIQVNTAGQIATLQLPVGYLGNCIYQNLRFVRYNRDFSEFYFPFDVKREVYVDRLFVNQPVYSSVLQFPNMDPNIYYSNTPVMGTLQPYKFDSLDYKGASFMDLSNISASANKVMVKFTNHVIVESDKDWYFKGQSYFTFTDKQNKDQVLYAALFTNGAKQVIKAWLVQDLPAFESLEELGKRIVRETFGTGEKSDEAAYPSVIKKVSFTTPNPKFVYEDEGAKEKISSFTILSEPTTSYFWLSLARSTGDEKKFWLLTGNIKVDIEKALGKYPRFFSALYLSDHIDNNGNFYLTEEEGEGKKEKTYLVQYNFNTGEKKMVNKYEISGGFDDPQVAIAPDGKHIAVYSVYDFNDNYVMDLTTGKTVFKLDIPSAKDRKLKLNVNNDFAKYLVKFSNDGKFLYAISSFTTKQPSYDHDFSSVYLNTYRLQN